MVVVCVIIYGGRRQTFLIESVLIVSHSDNAINFFNVTLAASLIRNITVKQTCAEARLALIDRDFDLVIINSPLKDETGEQLAKQIAVRGISQVILVVNLEQFEAIAFACENDGVLCVPKPINRQNFWAVLSLAKSAFSRFAQAHTENQKLKRSLEDIKIIDRAKCALIEHKGYTENRAHKFIAQEAMAKRVGKREIADQILHQLRIDTDN